MTVRTYILRERERGWGCMGMCVGTNSHVSRNYLVVWQTTYVGWYVWTAFVYTWHACVDIDVSWKRTIDCYYGVGSPCSRAHKKIWCNPHCSLTHLVWWPTASTNLRKIAHVWWIGVGIFQVNIYHHHGDQNFIKLC